MAKDVLVHYWTRPAEQVLRALDASAKDGLEQRTASRRLAASKPRKERLSTADRDADLFLSQFKSPTVLMMLVASGYAIYLGQRLDGVMIIAIVIISTLLVFWQERKAHHVIDELTSLTDVTCKVVRDGQEEDIASSKVVPGDVIILTAGSTAPADSMILESKELYVDEARLTGETFPAWKYPGEWLEETALSKRANCVFEGTHVVSGWAKVVAVKTGKDTEFGKLQAHLAKRAPESDFERGVRAFGLLLLQVSFVFVLVTAAVNVLSRRAPLDSFMLALALAFTMTPQLLPAMINVCLASGARRMAAARVMPKNLQAIEPLSSMNVLCTDKTGTLTEGTMHFHGAFDIDGKPSARVKLLGFLNAAMETSVPNALEDSIRKQGLKLSGYRKLDETPYDFARKRTSILVDDDQTEGYLLITKGEIANVLAACTMAHGQANVAVPLGQVQERLQEQIQQASAKGYRVIGIAYKRVPENRTSIAHEKGMVLSGYMLLSDVAKENIFDSITSLNALGVKLKIITGDNPMVAHMVAQQCGFANPRIMTGKQFKHLQAGALSRVAMSIDVFAEVEPSQKEVIVQALKTSGNVVGFYGDAINDAPALQAADVGICSNGAVDVAKNAAQMILMDPDLGVIGKGVQEARAAVANSLKSVCISTSAGFGNMLAITCASCFLPFIPMLPKQIMLVNLLTDFPKLAVAGDRADRDLTVRGQRFDVKHLRRSMFVFGIIGGVFSTLMFVGLMMIMRGTLKQFRAAWFVECALCATLTVLALRTRGGLVASKPSAFLLVASIISIGLACALPFVESGGAFGFAALNPDYFTIIATVALGYVLLTEATKFFFFRPKRRSK